MKPHISKSKFTFWWQCVAQYGSHTFCGTGHSPEEAYRKYIEAATGRKIEEVNAKRSN